MTDCGIDGDHCDVEQCETHTTLTWGKLKEAARGLDDDAFVTVHFDGESYAVGLDAQEASGDPNDGGELAIIVTVEPTNAIGGFRFMTALAEFERAISHYAISRTLATSPDRAAGLRDPAYLRGLMEKVEAAREAVMSVPEVVALATPQADATTEGSGVSSPSSRSTEADNSALIAELRSRADDAYVYGLPQAAACMRDAADRLADVSRAAAALSGEKA